MAARKRKARGHGWSRKKPRVLQTPAEYNISTPKSNEISTGSCKESSGAVQAVFNTAELLENILVHVEFYTLITAQRVCTQFRDTVASSTAIKQKLFLSAEDKQELRIGAGADYGELKFIHVPACDYEVPVNLPETWTTDGIYPGRINPILKPRGPWKETQYLELTYDGFNPRHDLHGYADGASWQRMYLSNPPCTWLVNAGVTFKVKKSLEVSGLHATVHVRITEPSGITFGDLVDRAMRRPCTCWDGKEWADFNDTAAGKSIQKEKKSNGWFAYVDASTGSGIRGMTLFLPKIAIPSEQQWQGITAAATRGTAWIQQLGEAS